MKDFIQRLPFDIVSLIIPYTYNIQDKSLLRDIVNYTESKNILLDSYYTCWIIERQSLDPEEHKNWLINDIFGYANDYNALMFGYIDKFYNIFLRNKCLKSNDDIHKYIYKLEGKNVSTQINIFLGLLTVNERKEVISNFRIRNY